MSETLRRGLFPVLALVALWLAGGGARADDVAPPAGGFGPPLDGETREAATAPRVYVPLQPAEPHEVEQELAPMRATAFGRRLPAGAGPASSGAVKASPAASPASDRSAAEAPLGH